MYSNWVGCTRDFLSLHTHTERLCGVRGHAIPTFHGSSITQSNPLVGDKKIMTTTMRSNVNLPDSDQSYIVIRGNGNDLLSQNVSLLPTNENNNSGHFLFGVCLPNPNCQTVADTVSTRATSQHTHCHSRRHQSHSSRGFSSVVVAVTERICKLEPRSTCRSCRSTP